MQRRLLIPALLMLLLTAAWLFLRNNFHPVIEGEVYRSAQLSGGKLEEVITEHGIRTVINLRRPQSDEGWYQAEKSVTAQLGVAHHDVPMDLTFSPRIDRLIELRDLLENAPRPLLFHCRAGADRTGLAAVMTKLLDGESTLEEARAQVGLKYHVVRDDSLGIPFFNEYQAWLERLGIEHSPEQFNHWLEHVYVDLSGNVHFLVDPIRGQTWWRPWGRYAQGERFMVRRSEDPELQLSGWAFDTRHRRLLSSVALSIGGISAEEVEYGIPQPWLIEDFGEPAWINSGWRASWFLEEFPDGCHDLELTFKRLDGSTWTTPPAARICIE